LIFEALREAHAAYMAHLPQYAQAVEAYRAVRNLPRWWSMGPSLPQAVFGQHKKRRVVAEPDILSAMQRMLDVTHLRRYTQDRKGSAIPGKLKVEQVVMLQNEARYVNYRARRQEVVADLEERGMGCKMNLGEFCRRQVIKTHRAVRHWDGLGPISEEPVDPGVHEFYLMHGTSPAAADSIAETNFRLDLAGSHIGTLYGPGIYFAECSTKADEYAETAQEGPQKGWRPMLVCRVMLGRVNYCDQVYPDVPVLVRQCLDGTYHSICGDREKCRRTFREFVIYNLDQVLPEYIIWYSQVPMEETTPP